VSRYAPAPAPAGAVRPRRRRYNFRELLELPEPTWLIRGVLPEQALAVLYGAPGSAKTFLSIDWALHVATGRQWLGHDVRRAGVAYVVAEGVGGWPKRVRAWGEENGTVADSAFAALSPGVNLLDPADNAALRDELRALPEPPALVIVDTLARCLIGGDENSARDVGQAIAALDALRADFGATVLIIHHTAKGEEAEERGSSALRGAADSMHKLTWDEDRLVLSCQKQKDSAEGPDLDLDLEPREHSCLIMRSLGRQGPTPSEARLLATLVGFGEDGASTTALMDAAGLPKTTFYRTLNGLVDSGDIERRRQGNRTQYLPCVDAEVPESREVPTAGGTKPGGGDGPFRDHPGGGTIHETEKVPVAEWDQAEARQ
jgi:hypothetical protein